HNHPARFRYSLTQRPWSWLSQLAIWFQLVKIRLNALDFTQPRHRVVYGSNARQAVRTASIMQRNRGSFRRLPRNGSYFDSHGALMNPNSTARSRKSIAASASFTSAKQSATHQAKISSHSAAARSSGVMRRSRSSRSPRRAQAMAGANLAHAMA